jgi:hypothetical protein
MKIVSFVSIAVFIACSITGCGPKISSSTSMERQQDYGRLAIVCAPKEGANPAYAPLILKQAQSRIFPLDFLVRVDCLYNVTVDTNSIPPVVQLDNFSDYDAVMAMVYSYEAGHVYLDLHMVDTVTIEQIWHHRFDSPDPEIKTRLLSQGLFTPAVIRKEFYGL